jgi:hypothetical protein
MVYLNILMKRNDIIIIIMKEDEIIVQIQKINSEFYHAFENLSIERMEGLWKHGDSVVCIHPGWDLFTGWMSWNGTKL